MRKVLAIVLLFVIVAGFKNDKPAYRLFTAEGKNIKYVFHKLFKNIHALPNFCRQTKELSNKAVSLRSKNSIFTFNWLRYLVGR